MAIRRPLLPLLALVALAAALAACGGEAEGEGAAVASVAGDGTAASNDATADGDATGTQDPEQSRQDAMLEYARCMRENGVDMDDPKPGQPMRLTVGKGQRKAFEKAQKACESIRRNAMPEPTAEQKAAMHEAGLQFAKCMRDHGVTNMPDPTVDGGISIGRDQGIDPQDPTFKKAEKACQPIVRKAMEDATASDGAPELRKEGR